MRAKEAKYHTSITQPLKEIVNFKISQFSNTAHTLTQFLQRVLVSHVAISLFAVILCSDFREQEEMILLPFDFVPHPPCFSTKSINVDVSRCYVCWVNFTRLEAFSQLVLCWGPCLISNHSISQDSPFCSLTICFRFSGVGLCFVLFLFNFPLHWCGLIQRQHTQCCLSFTQPLLFSTPSPFSNIPWCWQDNLQKGKIDHKSPSEKPFNTHSNSFRIKNTKSVVWFINLFNRLHCRGRPDMSETQLWRTSPKFYTKSGKLQWWVGEGKQLMF